MSNPMIDAINRDLENFRYHQQHIKEFQGMMEEYVQKNVPPMIDAELQRYRNLLEIEIRRLVQIEVDKMKNVIYSDKFKKELSELISVSVKNSLRIR